MKLSQFEAAFAAFCLSGPCERQRLGSTENIGTFSPVSHEADAKLMGMNMAGAATPLVRVQHHDAAQG